MGLIWVPPGAGLGKGGRRSDIKQGPVPARVSGRERELPGAPLSAQSTAAATLDIMLVWPVFLLAVALVVGAAKPDPPDITTVGSQKLATASDCSKPVAFSGTRANVEDARVILSETLLDQGVGYTASTGIFTTYCPGLYQFSFAGYGSEDLRMTLKRKLSKTNSWHPIVGSGPHGGANVVLLRMGLGDQVAVFVDSGKPADSTTFSGFRIAKE